ncbi:hypothetical protein HanRHA438_Chr17g0805431 [Helianthus annuus]|nr:hypothetical protein HanRHA438_Chr17g0805431 [Helianthus annuus]
MSAPPDPLNLGVAMLASHLWRPQLTCGVWVDSAPRRYSVLAGGGGAPTPSSLSRHYLKNSLDYCP